MQSILTTFGIDWRLLLVNAINFGILLLGLWYFLYTPIMNMLEARRKKVARGVQDAEAAKRALQEVEASRSVKLAEAGKQADDLLASARAAAAAKERELIGQGENSAGALVREAEAQARELKARAVQDSKQEVAKLIVLGIEKALTK